MRRNQQPAGDVRHHASLQDLAILRIPAERRLAAVELRELNRIQVNLNQMARVLNPGATAAPAETQEAKAD